jgi:hypothetical protein
MRDIPDFPAIDMFSGKAIAPYRGFGGFIQDSNGLERQLHADAARVRKEIQDTFRAKLKSSTSIFGELDDIVERMWKTGWGRIFIRVRQLSRVFRSTGARPKRGA